MTDILLPRPPRDSGWESDDLDKYDLPDHVELIYGALEVMMSPQRSWHHRLIRRIANLLDDAASPDWLVEQEMTVRINKKNRPEPDLLIVRNRPDYDLDTKWFKPEDVALAVEVESEESETRDRELKPILYAKAEIPNYLRVAASDNFEPVFYHYRLRDGEYQLVSEHLSRLVLDEPVKIDTAIGRLR